MPPKVIVTDDKTTDLAAKREVLEDIGADVVAVEAKTVDRLLDVAEDATAVIPDANTPITRRLIEGIDTLEVVGRAGIGVDNIDLQAAENNDVTVVNVPAYCLDEVTTHALGLALACLRRIPTFDRSVKSGTWDWSVGQPIPRLAGSTFGLIAFGKIARRLAKKLQGFDIDVISYDPYVPEYRMADLDVEKVSFDDLLTRSDIVSIHAPLTDETRCMVDSDAFAAMKDEAVLVNTARGPIVDETVLRDALIDGEIAAAGLDVMEKEPPTDSPLLDRDNVILTPHVAWYSEASREELSRSVAEDVARVLQGEEPEAPVTLDTSWL